MGDQSPTSCFDWGGGGGDLAKAIFKNRSTKEVRLFQGKDHRDAEASVNKIEGYLNKRIGCHFDQPAGDILGLQRKEGCLSQRGKKEIGEQEVPRSKRIHKMAPK